MAYSDYAPQVQPGPVVTITNGTAITGAIDCQGTIPCSIQVPAGMTGTFLSFQGSADGTTYADLYDDGGNEYAIPITASARFIPLDFTLFRQIRYLKVRSGKTAAPTNEGGDRTLLLGVRIN